GHVELLRAELSTTGLRGDVLRRLAVIETQLGRVTGIITQLLDLTRRSAGAPTQVDLNRLLRDTVELVRPGISGAGLMLRVDAEAGLPPVRGHASQLQQVILNLLTNAIDATMPGGRVEVRTRATTEPAHVLMEVRDT